MPVNWWNLAYLFRPSWDRGYPPEPLTRLVESRQLGAGRAVDIGCGTGTTAVYLAQRGFDAVGIDIAPRAIARARQKASRAGVRAAFLVANITNLPSAPELEAPFDLAVDIGCFHSLGPQARDAYVRTLLRLLKPGGSYFLQAFIRASSRRPVRIGPPGVAPGEVEARFRPDFGLTILPASGRPPPT
jgi:cyclopropane fatty-acyl-phospholipid synthase-like methyltransferase